MKSHLTAGVTLKAARAVAEQEIFTAGQVAYLLHLAYESGRVSAAGEDMAEVVACWLEHANPVQIRTDRVAARIAEMEQSARDRAEREGRIYRPYRGGPVDWETGRPVREMAVAA